MTVFKATGADMTCHMGKCIFKYKLGVPAYADDSKCGHIGLHACEYILDCLNYYGLNSKNRFFKAEAAGDIAEDGCDTRIACTELTLIEELSNRDIAREALIFICRHPKRTGWQKSTHGVQVCPNSAEVSIRDGIAIARGTDPKVRGCQGAHLGLIKENQDGSISNVNLFTVEEPVRPGEWYTVEKLEEILNGKEKS